MSDTFKWGILGTGVIARKFAGQLGATDRGALAATGSRTAASAQSFAAEFGGTAHGSYEALIADPQVEAVYVSLPNHLHREWTIRALRAGKHVLCEKPFARNAAEAEDMFAAARQTGRVVVEGFMYRCLPVVREFIRTARAGTIGEVKLIRANFTFCRPALDTDARYQPAMAGGSLMDVGAYCINLTRALAGREPTDLRVFAHLHEKGVDDYAAGLLRFGDGLLSTFTSGMTVESDRTVFVGGSEGWMAIECPWLLAESFDIVKGGQRQTVRVPAPKPLFALEADAFAQVARVVWEADPLGMCNFERFDIATNQIDLTRGDNFLKQATIEEARSRQDGNLLEIVRKAPASPIDIIEPRVARVAIGQVLLGEVGRGLAVVPYIFAGLKHLIRGVGVKQGG